ncbi:unnamed protein product, partial [Prorocentrum cordatum]
MSKQALQDIYWSMLGQRSAAPPRAPGQPSRGGRTSLLEANGIPQGEEEEEEEAEEEEDRGEGGGGPPPAGRRRCRATPKVPPPAPRRKAPPPGALPTTGPGRPPRRREGRGGAGSRPLRQRELPAALDHHLLVGLAAA